MKKIPLTQGLFATVDDDVFDYMMQFKWHASKSGATHYAVRHIRPVSGCLGKMKMHHDVIGKPQNAMVVDHIDGNGLNNVRENLRFVSVRENQHNQKHSTIKRHSVYPGVSRYIKGNFDKWVAGAKINGKRKTLGYYDTEQAAYRAYLFATYATELRSTT